MKINVRKGEEQRAEGLRCPQIRAYVDGKYAGHIFVCVRDPKPFFYVGSITVNRRREGVGTRLYEEAAKLACAEGRALRSSNMDRNAMSDGFWKKQIRKGRAVDDGTYTELVNPCQVTSLAGSSKKTKRSRRPRRP